MVEVTVRSAEINNARYDKGVQVMYCVRGDDEQTATPMVVKGGRTPQFSHSRVVSLSCVVEEHLDYFETGCITFLIYGRQADSPPDKRLQKMSTRVRTQQSCLVIRTTTRKLAIADKSRPGRHITVLPVV